MFPPRAAAWRSIWSTALIRIVLFLGFLYVISRMKDIHRVFEYHGAEHKVVFNFESGQAGDRGERAAVRHLAPPLRHEFPAGGDGDRDDLLRVPAVRLVCGEIVARILLLPVITGVSYELIRSRPSVRRASWRS